MFLFLTVVQSIVAAALVGVILMQRSEGGGLGVGGGGPGGLLSARGASDFLTRSTAILATLFVVLSIVMAAVAVGSNSDRKIDDSLNRDVIPAQTAPDPLTAPAESGTSDAGAAQSPASDDPLAGAAQ